MALDAIRNKAPKKKTTHSNPALVQQLKMIYLEPCPYQVKSSPFRCVKEKKRNADLLKHDKEITLYPKTLNKTKNPEGC